MSQRKSPQLESRLRDPEASHLREQVRLLTLENEKLRAIIAENGLSGELSPETRNEADGAHRERRTAHRSVTAHAPITPARPGTPRAPGRGCSCKGNCSSRICGCVKRNIPCAEFCRCGDEICQNSEPDKENIGDPNNQPQLSIDATESLAKLSKLALTEKQQSKPLHPALEPVNKRLNEIGKPRSLFSPDVADNQFNFETGDIDVENISLRFGDAPETGEPEEEAVVEKSLDRNKNKKKKTRKEKNVNVDNRELDLETEGDVQSEMVYQAPGDVPQVGEAAKETVVKKPLDRNRNKNKKTRKEKNVNIDDRDLDLETVDDVESEKTLLAPGDAPEAEEAAAEAVAEKVSDRKKSKKKKTKGERNEDDEEDRKDKETHRSATTPNAKATSPHREEQQETTDFNPMKPRRQLSRSPLVSKTVPRPERPIDASEIPLPAPLKEEPEEEPSEPEELKQDIVPDWDKHMATLVECTICGRKLYPHRIRKHEASCQNI